MYAADSFVATQPELLRFSATHCDAAPRVQIDAGKSESTPMNAITTKLDSVNQPKAFRDSSLPFSALFDLDALFRPILSLTSL